MYESENKAMNPDEELVDILLDFIIVAANLAKSINHAIKLRQIKERPAIDRQHLCVHAHINIMLFAESGRRHHNQVLAVLHRTAQIIWKGAV